MKRTRMRRRIKPGVTKAANAQRIHAYNRARGRCEFELVAQAVGWVRCAHHGQEAAHIYPRTQCGKAREHPDVVAWACRRCHVAFDDPALAKGLKVRVPPALEQAAWDAIAAVAKVLPVRKMPPDG
jgi:hypothetical protein